MARISDHHDHLRPELVDASHDAFYETGLEMMLDLE